MKEIRYGTNWDERADETSYGKIMIDFEKKCLIQHINKDAKILDVGGGTGIHASYIQNKGYQIELIDIDKKALIKTRKNGIKCYLLSGLVISTLKKKYDLVYCLDVPFLI